MKIVRRILRILLGLLLLLTVLITTALHWPLPDVEVPERHGSLLIRSIHIIDIRSGEVWNDQDILIEKNRIAEIRRAGQMEVSDTVFTLEGEGKYLMPGLWDMHTHSSPYSPWLHHPLYIANGVTGVRDMSGQLNKPDNYWSGSKERLQWNEQMAADKRVAPRYVLQSSFQINGAASVPTGYPEFFKVQHEEDIPLLLDYYRKEQVDFIKVYFEIPPQSYRKLAQDAPRYGMHLAGHKPMFVSLEEAINLGQRSFEHARVFMYECFPKAEALRNSPQWEEIYRASRTSMVNDFDTVKAGQLMDLMRIKNTHWTPTLQTVKMGAFANDEDFLQSPYLQYVPAMRQTLWWNPDRSRYSQGNQVDKDFYEAAQQQVGMAHKKGVPIMMGTDVPDTYVFAGFSVHAELKDLTDCGLSNLEALQTATLVPAKYCGLAHEYGSVERGKVADLIILDKNPMENIENTRSIQGVVFNGIYYSPQKLENLKKTTASLARSFHMNVKFVYSLLSSPLMRRQLAD